MNGAVTTGVTREGGAGEASRRVQHHPETGQGPERARQPDAVLRKHRRKSVRPASRDASLDTPPKSKQRQHVDFTTMENCRGSNDTINNLR